MKVNLFKPASTAGKPQPPRSRTGPSIRGKISGPIPIPGPADDEFPMRNPGTGIATPLGGEGKEKQLQVEQPAAANPAPAVETVDSALNSDVARDGNTDSVVMAASVTASGSGSAHGSAGRPGSGAVARGSPQSQRRTNPSSAFRYSAVSEATENTNNSREKPQRKKSTLRGAFSKLFGRRKKTETSSTVQPVGPQPESTLGGPSQHHQSTPSTFVRERNREKESKRSASLPITEFDRALRSHSVGPNDMTAIESARNSLHADFGLASRRRAATISSQLFRGRDGELTGLSPRPASIHTRRAGHLGAEENPDDIGRAITSDVTGQKRRSRSLNGLDDASGGRAGARRRSDEIRYWRQSYDPAFTSPISSDPPDREPDDAHYALTDLPKETAEANSVPRTPPEPFNFGTMTHLNPMAGMKITEAVSLESRIGNLEERMRRVEKMVSELCLSIPGVAIEVDGIQPPSEPPMPDRKAPVPNVTAGNWANAPTAAREAQNFSRQGSIYSRDSQLSFGDAPGHTDSTQLSAPPNAHRPTSDSTIRGAVSLPTMARREDGAFTPDQHMTFLALLEAERAARQNLEAQVWRLTARLDAIAPVRIKGGHQGLTSQLDPPPTSRSFGNVSAFDHDDSDDGGYHDDKERTIHVEDSGVAAGSTMGPDEDDHSKSFATPREEYPQGYGVFGQELAGHEDNDSSSGKDNEEERRRQKAARTLSLSQLTLGKHKSHTKAVI